MPFNKLDGEYERELTAAGNQIASWKKWYFRKNSKYAAEIKLRCWHEPEDQRFWKYYLELSRNRKTEQHRITKDTYEVMARDKEANRLISIEFVTLYSFVPSKKTKEL